MSNIKKLMMSAAGGAGLDVDEVFSTYLYTGNGSTQTITNGIDLDGEGGLVFIKRRDGTANNWGWYDTERGPDSHIKSNANNAEQTTVDVEVKDFNSNGFDLGPDWNAYINTNGGKFVSWTFRKAPKFFDVLTYTGDGTTNRQISHNLGSVPGCIIVKRTNGLKDWAVYHRGKGSTHYGTLNTTEPFYDYHTWWQDTDPTSTDFTVGNSAFVNANGDTYVAYLFAHNDGDGEFGPDGGQDIIKCGSFTDSSSGWSVDLGFEPQFLLSKRADGSGNWEIVDTMRGFTANPSYTRLYPNLSNTEQTVTKAGVNSTGFFSTSAMETDGAEIIYIAIRRGSLFPPESATDVFAIDTLGGTSPNPPGWNAGFPVDFAIRGNTAVFAGVAETRLLDNKFLFTNGAYAETTSALTTWDYMDGFFNSTSVSSNYYSWMWKRAPGYFDVVAWTGVAGTAQTINHNLGVVPEMIWTKRRNAVSGWIVYNKTITATNWLALHDDRASSAESTAWNNTEPTASSFTAGQLVSATGAPVIAYLFATLPGISKVGSYTGNGSSQTINCGFTSGARFIHIKRTDSTGDWHMWDTERGIVAGNDPYFLTNRESTAEVTSNDSVDPANSGFIVNQNSTTNINVSSASYIFYAIA